jgi:hypothetical protein
MESKKLIFPMLGTNKAPFFNVWKKGLFPLRLRVLAVKTQPHRAGWVRQLFDD